MMEKVAGRSDHRASRDRDGRQNERPSEILDFKPLIQDISAVNNEPEMEGLSSQYISNRRESNRGGYAVKSLKVP
jgi:hypothetical protein